RIGRCHHSRRLKLCDQRKSARDPSDVCVSCGRNCKNQSTVRKGNPFFDSTCPRFALVNLCAQRRSTCGGETIASRLEQRAVPVQNDFAEKHPGQRAECQVRPER